MDCYSKIEQISNDFIRCRKLLIAIGDETRQTIITVLMGSCSALRVGEITERTHLSRPAVSHHIRIMLVFFVWTCYNYCQSIFTER